jgi:hypothetical protein
MRFVLFDHQRPIVQVRNARYVCMFRYYDRRPNTVVKTMGNRRDYLVGLSEICGVLSGPQIADSDSPHESPLMQSSFDERHTGKTIPMRFSPRTITGPIITLSSREHPVDQDDVSTPKVMRS